MTPHEANSLLEARTAQIKAAAAAADPAPLQRAARQVGAAVKDIAGRQGHVIEVRVVERPNGVRLTVKGRYAARYRRMVETTMARVVPQAAVEIRTQITQSAR
jgi:hypothetical protein